LLKGTCTLVIPRNLEYSPSDETSLGILRGCLMILFTDLAPDGCSVVY